MVKRQSAGKFAGQKDKRETANKKYYDDIKKEHYSNEFFSFKDSMVIETIEDYNHDYRLILYLMHPTLASVGPDDGIATILTNLYAQGHISGHMKDIGATELADAINYCEGLWEILGQLRNEMAAVTLLDNPAFDDATVTSGAAHAFWKPESFNTFLEGLEGRNLVVPDFLLYLLDKFTGIRLKFTESYEIYGEEIPACYMVMGVRLSTVTVMETSRDTMAAYKGSAVQFFNKFGIGYKSFTREMATKVSEYPGIGPEATFWFDTVPLEIRGKAKDLVWLGSNQVDFSGGIGWTAWKKWLYKGQVPEENIFTQCFATHDATNNEYGGLFTYLTPSATEGRSCMLKYGIDDTTPGIVATYTVADKFLFFNWLQFGQDDLPGAGEWELQIVGTETTANIVISNTPSSYLPHIKGFDYTLNYKRTTLKTISKKALDAFLLRKMISVAGLK